MDRKRSIAVLLLAAMMIGGMAYISAGQRAFAHNFSGDQSASFLANVETIKIHLMLVGADYPYQSSFAADHAGHAVEHLDNGTIKEIGERNARLGKDLPAALEKLENSVKNNGSRSDVIQQIKDINGLLGETVKIRIDNSQLSNSTVQALKFTGVVNEILEAYNGAFGIDEDSAGGINMGNSSSTSPASGNTTTSTEQSHDKMVDMTSYQSARWLSLKASSLYYGLNAIAPTGSDASMTKLRAGLDQLKDAIESQKPADDVTLIVHSQIHQNISDAFHLPMAQGGEEKMNDSTSSKHSPGSNMTGNMTR